MPNHPLEIWRKSRVNILIVLLYNCGMISFILSFFVGYILSFGLVRFRTIRLSARASAHIECRCSRPHSEDMTITNVIIKTPERKRDWGMNDFRPRSDGLRIVVIFEKKQLTEIWSWTKRVEIRSWAWRLESWSWTRRVQLWTTGCAARCGVRWNSQHSKNCVSLSSSRKNLK